MSDERLLETIRDAVIGKDHVLDGPFGPRRVTYADYTASARSLSFLEDFLRDEVLPLYANTHSETSGTGLQTGRFREEARAIIGRAVGAGPDDIVLFSGSGATGAVHKLIEVMNLRIPRDLDARCGLSAHVPESERPVVFIGPYEHHSNELPWRESLAEVVVIDEDGDSHIDQTQLGRRLAEFAARPLKIGTFSAASNVTGIGSDVRGITALLHDHGALALWDYAAAGPYVRIDVAGRPTPGAAPEPRFALDAVFLSPHKLIGGPGTPGVLVAKRALFQNRVPTVPGGGTVAYVSSEGHRYVDDIVLREEGGTPDIVGAVRAGLVFQLKEAVGVELIEAREQALVRGAIERWHRHPGIRILGNTEAWRLSIVSFMVRYGSGFLHHNFVVALLNDLFGIQARGGCSCAGPYGHRLLGIDLVRSHAFESEILRGCEGIKPGWVRVSFSYFISDAERDYILAAVELVAEHGWKLLPRYRFEPDSGRWIHAERAPAPMSLFDLRYDGGHLTHRSRHSTEPEWALPSYLDDARRIFAEACPVREVSGTPMPSGDFEKLRWFPLPSEAQARLEKREP